MATIPVITDVEKRPKNNVFYKENGNEMLKGIHWIDIQIAEYEHRKNNTEDEDLKKFYEDMEAIYQYIRDEYDAQ